jgi:hypothetical protein
MVGIPLSEETQRRVELLFDGEDAALAAEILVLECGSNLPFCAKKGPVELERFRFAALKMSGGDLDRLLQAVEVAKQDWRDLLVAAGFANDPQAHQAWLPQRAST